MSVGDWDPFLGRGRRLVDLTDGYYSGGDSGVARVNKVTPEGCSPKLPCATWSRPGQDQTPGEVKGDKKKIKIQGVWVVLVELRRCNSKRTK